MNKFRKMLLFESILLLLVFCGCTSENSQESDLQENVAEKM